MSKLTFNADFTNQQSVMPDKVGTQPESQKQVCEFKQPDIYEVNDDTANKDICFFQPKKIYAGANTNVASGGSSLWNDDLPLLLVGMAGITNKTTQRIKDPERISVGILVSEYIHSSSQIITIYADHIIGLKYGTNVSKTFLSLTNNALKAEKKLETVIEGLPPDSPIDLRANSQFKSCFDPGIMDILVALPKGSEIDHGLLTEAKMEAYLARSRLISGGRVTPEAITQAKNIFETAKQSDVKFDPYTLFKAGQVYLLDAQSSQNDFKSAFDNGTEAYFLFLRASDAAMARESNRALADTAYEQALDTAILAGLPTYAIKFADPVNVKMRNGELYSNTMHPEFKLDWLEIEASGSFGKLFEQYFYGPAPYVKSNPNLFGRYMAYQEKYGKPTSTEQSAIQSEPSINIDPKNVAAAVLKESLDLPSANELKKGIVDPAIAEKFEESAERLEKLQEKWKKVEKK